MNQKFNYLIVFSLFLLMLIGCNPFQVTPDGSEQPTPIVEFSTASATPGTAEATEVAVETLSSTPTATIATAVTEQADSEASATPSTTETCLDSAAFVKDITVPDESQFEASTNFVKTWRIKNTGTCTWNSNYSIIHVSGHRIGAASSSFPFPAVVGPGEILDLSINLVAPADPGNYRGDWRFQNPQGQSFGVGQSGNNPVWVSIVVKEPSDGGGSISGFAWQDQDFDNEVEVVEYLPNVTITLSSGTNCGIELQTMVTDSDGRFNFNNLSAGSYCLTGTDGQVTVSQSGYQLAENQQLSEVNVTWPPVWPDPASITGWLWDDANADGMIQPEETYIAGVIVKLFRGACVGDDIPQQLQAETDNDGKFTFNGLQPGTYCLFIDATESNNATILQNGNWTFPDFEIGYHELTLLEGELVTPVNFGWAYD
jgi:hypothetical protein